jgi:probable rRNA maturation factor
MEITLKNLQKTIPIPRKPILKAAQAALRKLSLEAGCLSIVFVSPQRMRAMNRKYLKHDYVTDVLAFSLGGLFGEIIICPHQARRNAGEYRTSTQKELVLYVIHGILHLAGFNDHGARDKTQMRRMERELLA